MIETEDFPNEVTSALADLASHYQDFEAINRSASQCHPPQSASEPAILPQGVDKLNNMNNSIKTKRWN